MDVHYSIEPERGKEMHVASIQTAKNERLIKRIENVHIITPGQPGVVHLSQSVSTLTSKSVMRVHVTNARSSYERIVFPAE